jgi:hypothetical protein
MNQKKDRTEIEKKIISSVKREMKKPRLAESVRNGRRARAAPIAKGPAARSEKV